MCIYYIVASKRFDDESVTLTSNGIGDVYMQGITVARVRDMEPILPISTEIVKGDHICGRIAIYCNNICLSIVRGGIFRLFDQLASRGIFNHFGSAFDYLLAGVERKFINA